MAFDTGLALSGAGTGASVGAAFGPIGAGVGAVVGLGMGFMGKDKPDIPPPPASVDPAQLAFLEELKAKRTAIESGMSTEFQLGRNLLQQAQSSQLESASRLVGGDVGAAIAAQDKITQGTAQMVSQLTGTATSQAMQYTALIDKLTQAIAQRKLDTATTLWSEARGRAASIEQVQSQNLVNALMSPGVTGTLTDTVSGVADYIREQRNIAARNIAAERGQFTIAPITGYAPTPLTATLANPILR